MFQKDTITLKELLAYTISKGQDGRPAEFSILFTKINGELRRFTRAIRVIKPQAARYYAMENPSINIRTLDNPKAHLYLVPLYGILEFNGKKFIL